MSKRRSVRSIALWGICVAERLYSDFRKISLHAGSARVGISLDNERHYDVGD